MFDDNPFDPPANLFNGLSDPMEEERDSEDQKSPLREEGQEFLAVHTHIQRDEPEPSAAAAAAATSSSETGTVLHPQDAARMVLNHPSMQTFSPIPTSLPPPPPPSPPSQGDFQQQQPQTPLPLTLPQSPSPPTQMVPYQQQQQQQPQQQQLQRYTSSDPMAMIGTAIERLSCMQMDSQQTINYLAQVQARNAEMQARNAEQNKQLFRSLGFVGRKFQTMVHQQQCLAKQLVCHFVCVFFLCECVHDSNSFFKKKKIGRSLWDCG